MSKRPKLDLEKTTLDRAYDLISVLSLIALIVYPLLYLSQVSGEVPTHYNAQGEVDNTGHMQSVWIIVVIGILFFFFLGWLKRKPHLYNFPVKITPENARFQYHNASQMIAFLKTSILLSFAYINYITINVGMGKLEGLHPLFLPVFLLIISGGLIYYTVKSVQEKPQV